MTYRRGDGITCALPGDFGKPRPAIVVQSDLFNATHPSVTVCPVTTHEVEAPLFRVRLRPVGANGLKRESHAMADKLTTLRAERVGSLVGRLSDDELQCVDEAVMRWLGLGG
jgi:mRNA interferase MazF